MTKAHRDIPATEFKAKCLELMDRVAERGESFVVTKRGKAVARLTPVEPAAEDSIFGCFAGRAVEDGDLISPAVAPDAWGTLREAGARARRG